jgi:hypothetical protein
MSIKTMPVAEDHLPDDDDGLIPIKLTQDEWENVATYLLAHNNSLKKAQAAVLDNKIAAEECNVQINQTVYLRNAILYALCDRDRQTQA